MRSNGYPCECGKSCIICGSNKSTISLTPIDIYNGYYMSNYSYYAKHDYREYRCRVSCLDSNGNELAYLYTDTIRVDAAERYGGVGAY
jgi:hypothetical protein